MHTNSAYLTNKKFNFLQIDDQTGITNIAPMINPYPLTTQNEIFQT